jgi:hypothetical protein
MIMVTSALSENGMNPKSFAYGSFSFYALWLFAHLARFIWALAGGSNGLFASWGDPTGYDGLFTVGRMFCLVAGVCAIPLAYATTLLIYRRSFVALIAATFLSINVFHIQLSRFFTSDITLSTLCLAALLMLVVVYRSGALPAYLGLGVCIGLATATKISSAFLATPLLVTLAFSLVRDHGWITSAWVGFLGAITLVLVVGGGELGVSTLLANQTIAIFSYRVPAGGVAIAALGPLLLLSAIPMAFLSSHLALTTSALAIAAFTFASAQPFAILDFNTFVQQTREQTSMVQGLWRPPYTIQYEHTTPYLYHLYQMMFFTMGVPLFLVAVIGTFFVMMRASIGGILIAFGRENLSKVNVGEIILLVFMLVFFVATAGFQVKFPRYLMPIYPVLFIFGAALFLPLHLRWWGCGRDRKL